MALIYAIRRKRNRRCNIWPNMTEITLTVERKANDTILLSRWGMNNCQP
jgi:hypothetical protein